MILIVISSIGEMRKLRLGELLWLARGEAGLGSKPRDGCLHSFCTLLPSRPRGLQGQTSQFWGAWLPNRQGGAYQCSWTLVPAPSAGHGQARAVSARVALAAALTGRPGCQAGGALGGKPPAAQLHVPRLLPPESWQAPSMHGWLGGSVTPRRSQMPS